MRFIPTGTDIMLELVYETEETELKSDNGKYAGIDIGVDNLLTVVTNDGTAPFIVNGKIPKSVNQFYNKETSRRKSICQRESSSYSSKMIQKLTAKRNRRMEDYMHKASRFVVEECAVRGVHSIIIGKNAGWKQESKLSRNIIKSEEYTEDYSKPATAEQ